MFSLTVTEDEIKEVLSVIKTMVYPDSISLLHIACDIFYPDRITDIHKRKVRLCIAELRKRGFLIIAKRGYSIAGDDPEEVIHFINGLYSRAHSLTTDADIMFHQAKLKYGDELSKKICQLPEQPMLDITTGGNIDIKVYMPDPPQAEPVYKKSYDRDGTLHNV